MEDGVSTAKKDHYIKVIIEESDKMGFIINDMLDLFRLVSGISRLRKTSFMLSELTEKVTDRLIHFLKDKHLQVMVIPANELPVYADAGWIEQVILNFLTNAIRDAEGGSTITVNVQSYEKTSVLSIHNKGESIPEDQLELDWGFPLRSEY